MVTSCRLYGLTLVMKDLRCMGVCCDSLSSVTDCQVQGHVAALGPGQGLGHDISLGQATGVHRIDNYVVLGEQSRVSAMATRAVGILSGVSRSRGYIQGQAAVVWSWWWCVHQLVPI